MLPLVFLPGTPTLLAGRGPAFAKRRALLEGAGLTRLSVHDGLPPALALEGRQLIFGAGLTDAESEWLATAARMRGIPVNIEDVPHLCDVHVPALVRRGELLLTVSTGGGAPALSAALRGWLEDAFGEEWAGRLEEVAALRARLRAEGHPPVEVIRAVRAHLDAAAWLACGRPGCPQSAATTGPAARCLTAREPVPGL
ncbi:precorrin-2 dehydrogenase/sirohydrochlorin ferrochelatase family protein [Falsiroseomonas oryziterrae]|uniref:precorrin-2 dehydrogenase/sirohydrochlorin ferrochelatase family protein n=1 Tax=Falsiroseomonas oryziterrae TaxID=2911368 RepID=UPI001F36EAD8|nr:NAD(P)-dependent oxidoreductase [Roseomonas sp. NPKOSM-4]